MINKRSAGIVSTATSLYSEVSKFIYSFILLYINVDFVHNFSFHVNERKGKRKENDKKWSGGYDHSTLCTSIALILVFRLQMAMPWTYNFHFHA